MIGTARDTLANSVRKTTNIAFKLALNQKEDRWDIKLPSLPSLTSRNRYSSSLNPAK